MDSALEEEEEEEKAEEEAEVSAGKYALGQYALGESVSATLEAGFETGMAAPMIVWFLLDAVVRS
jgi:hypothetical protein